ncbi:DNA translocase FtsK [Vibrio paucivorans]|uniref:DNA translocase FtsK n=1 Tax=Vibrio paucivorans TaxID=2829489 RepID=A0A9X3CH41_9VIBR|nr:DNA translocase FtsK 4TM domain-containing protein [Vibrio paucivorans]MCW8335707.1 DNA translocase FtsK 4TM domain-containing protein [Vibrio paucivorans]
MFRENKKKVATIIKTGEEPQSSRLNGSQRLRECGLILAVLFSILLAVALVTFSPADPSWSQTAWGSDIQNAGGTLGAWIADTLFFVFGSLAYPIPIILTATAWIFLRTRGEDEPLDLTLWGTRLLGLVVLVLTSCGLADINFDDIWYFSSGGVIGDVLTSLALPTLNVLGTTLVLLFLWGAGFTLLTGISWLAIVEWLGERTIHAAGLLMNRIRGEKEETLAPDLSEYVPTSSKEERRDFDSVTMSDALPTEPEVEEHVPERRFNIHMPETAVAASATAVSVASEPVSAQPEQPMYHYDETEQERERPLTATIEELEMAAADANDLAPKEEVLAAAVVSPAAIESPIQQPGVPEADTMPWQVESNASTPELSEPAFEPMVETAADPAVEAVDEQSITEPVINEQQFERIAEDVEPDPLHIEPTISTFDVAEQEEEELTSHEFESEPEQLPVEDEAPMAELMPAEEVVQEDVEPDDEDVAAFQDMVSEAQANVAAQQNPFLVQQDVNLPKPAEPMPTLELLYHPEKRENFIDREALENIARLIEAKLADYKIKAEVVDIFPGPVITRFELDLAPGVKVSRISGLSMDLARSLSAMAVRVVEVIPGKPYVGLELPNMSRQTVYFSDVVGSQQFIEAKSPTTVVLGQDIAGEAVIADLSKMPHVLVAGTTGSGKSVGVNVMILSMLYKATPEEVRFIMIDPKMLELSVYEGIPHLLSEVVTDMKDASNALRWCVGEMERRYKLMSALGVRNIKGFNDKLKMAAEAGHPIHDPLWRDGDSMDPEPPLLENLPYIVVIVDEFADLMMVVGKKVEELIARLAQKARAAGIHLILATQRPSVDVITGLIKANIPTRVAFTVSTKTDSRTILDQGGAESLLGMGDMLYLPPGSSHTVRVHGAFASDDDVHAVVNNWKARGKPNYIDEITNGDQGPEALLPGEKPEGEEDMDPLFDQVVEHVVQSRRGSVSGVQRRFKIGYNRAARIVEQLEAQGIVSAPGHNGNREVLAPAPGREMN